MALTERRRGGNKLSTPAIKATESIKPLKKNDETSVGLTNAKTLPLGQEREEIVSLTKGKEKNERPGRLKGNHDAEIGVISGED